MWFFIQTSHIFFTYTLQPANRGKKQHRKICVLFCIVRRNCKDGNQMIPQLYGLPRGSWVLLTYKLFSLLCCCLIQKEDSQPSSWTTGRPDNSSMLLIKERLLKTFIHFQNNKWISIKFVIIITICTIQQQSADLMLSYYLQNLTVFINWLRITMYNLMFQTKNNNIHLYIIHIVLGSKNHNSPKYNMHRDLLVVLINLTGKHDTFNHNNLALTWLLLSK